MLRFLFASLSLLLISCAASANSDTSLKQIPHYPNLESLTHNISSPEEFLGYPLGEWHLRHDQANQYLSLLQRQTDKLTLEATGHSYEARQQLTAVISSPQNIANLDKIITQRALVKSQQNVDGPLVIWLAYSIHGDEASGAHAALATAYYLIASNDPWVKALLEQTVILITPSQNPDGMDRFAHWTNSNRGQIAVRDPQTREHQQDWPGGRTNHYLADLNRDWLFIRHPESQGRVALFHKWQPHYVGDFHEMGSNSSYFFQPGVQSRIHPLTPKNNHILTQKIAKFHQQALDKAGQSYFSNQLFDDYFYGKGSTYPDINGAIGVLFEQASARGQEQRSIQGGISLSQAINNQFTTSISSLKGAIALKQELINYQRDFYQQEEKRSHSGKVAGFLLRAQDDGGRIAELATMLAQHKITSYKLQKNLERDDKLWAVSDSLFVPIEQPQHRLIQAMFDQRTQFNDNTFYDISSWNLAHAFNLQMSRDIHLNTDKLIKIDNNTHFMPQEAYTITDDATAVIIDWRQSGASAMLSHLLRQNVLVKYATQEFILHENDGKTHFAPGSLQVSLQHHSQVLQSQPSDHQTRGDASASQSLIQTKQTRTQLIASLIQLAKQHDVTLYSATTSATNQGIDLGSPDFKTITNVRALLIGGIGTKASEVGEIWRFLDTRLSLPISMVNSERLQQHDIKPYSHIIFADGKYDHLNEVVARKLGQFVTQGGIIIAQQGALGWLKKRHLLRTDIKQPRHFDKLFSAEGLAYGDKREFEARKQIGGAIVGVNLDPSHPLAFGMVGREVSVLKNLAIGFSASSTEDFTVAGRYQEDLLKSGFLAEEYQRDLAGGPSMILEPKGKGAIVAFSDNLLFRSFWLGTEKVYANALFFTGKAAAIWAKD